MPFDSVKKKSSKRNLEKANEVLKKSRKPDGDTNFHLNISSDGHGESVDMTDACASELSPEEAREEVVEMMECKQYVDDIDMCIPVPAQPNSDSSIVATPSDSLLLQEQLQQRSDEIRVFSQEFFQVNEELIEIRLENTKLKEENISITCIISKTRQARDEYRNKVKTISIKLQKGSRTNYFMRSSNKSSSSNYSFVDQYSSLKNSTSKRNRKIAAIRALQQIGKEDDIAVFLDDVIKYCHDIPQQSFTYKLSLSQAACLKSKANLSLHQFEVIKMLLTKFTDKDIFPPVKLLCQLEKAQSKIDLFQASVMKNNENEDVAVVQCTNIKELLSWRLSEIGRDIRFDDYTRDTVVVAFGGDAGGGTTKLCLLIGNQEHPNSIDNVLVVAIFNAPDDYDSITKYVPDLVKQFNELDSISYSIDGSEVTKSVRKKVVGDFKFIGECLHHMKQSAVFHCFYCLTENHRGGLQLRHLDRTQRDDIRTIQSYTTFAKYNKGAYGVYEGPGPIFPTVNLFDHLTGPLHLVTGLFERYIYWPLWAICANLDNVTSFAIETDRGKSSRIADDRVQQLQELVEISVGRQKTTLQAELKLLLIERQLFKQTLSGIANGKVKELEKCWEKIGASRRAFYQVFSGNHTKKVLTEEGIRKTFNVFHNMMTDELRSLQSCMKELSTVMTLTGNKLLRPEECYQLSRSAWNFAFFLSEISPEDSVTQKLHTFLFHTPDIASSQQSLGRISEQGIEAKHAQCNRIERRFASCRQKEKRYLFIARELLCSTIASDFFKAWCFNDFLTTHLPLFEYKFTDPTLSAKLDPTV